MIVDNGSSLDIPASKHNMAFVIKQLPNPVKKEYTDYEFQVFKEFGQIKVQFAISRQTVCKKVIKETKSGSSRRSLKVTSRTLQSTSARRSASRSWRAKCEILELTVRGLRRGISEQRMGNVEVRIQAS
jgi:hypothetical protein